MNFTYQKEDILCYKNSTDGPNELENRDSLQKGFCQKNIILDNRTSQRRKRSHTCTLVFVL